MSSEEVVHPRPQLVRDWTDLSGTWAFAHDDDDRGLRERWYDDAAAFDREITVPYPPESQLSGVHDPGFYPVVWYRRTFDAPDRAGQRLVIHFGAVDYRASVWVNGAFVGDHEGGHTPFGFDVTDRLRPGDEQVVVVRAEDDPTDPSQPRGKQDWHRQPHSIWYHRTTGIWQPVWFERVPEIHVADLAWTPHLADGDLTLITTLNRDAGAGASVRVRIRLGDEVLADTSAQVLGSEVRQRITLPAAANREDVGRLLWSPESPTLLDAEVELRVDGQPSDTVQSYVGLRSAGYADGRFMLNHRPYYLRLVLGQNYWPESHLAAPSADALRREVELIKELGFNGVRVHQKVEDPRFLYWCDRLGLLVWGEMAATYAWSTTAAARLTREWLEAVQRDRSHPCIVTWVPLNESWGVAELERDPAQRHFASALYHLVKALDPTRPVISNDGWEHTDSDIWGVHDYAPTGAQITERYGTAEAVARALDDGRPGGRRVLLLDGTDRGQPVVLTEFGGLSYAPSTGERWFGYSTVRSPEELLAAFDDLVSAILDCADVAGFCYTQLTDTEQETNGLLDERRQPKIAPDQVRAIMNRPARAVPPEEVEYRRRQAQGG